MSTVHIALASVNGSDSSGRGIPVAHSRPISSEVITSSGSSQQSVAVVSDTPGSPAFGGLRQVWIITNSGGNIAVAFGANPTAVSGGAGGGWFILDGQTREFSAVAGDKVAVIN